MNPIQAALENRVPDDIVLVDSVTSLTAGQLLGHIDEFRLMLARAGIDRLGLLAGNSVAWVSADLACQFADICLLPMPVFFADAQLRHSMQSAGINAVLTDDPQRVTALAGIDRAPNDCGRWQGLTLLRFANGPRFELPAGTQKITFTSGSTGAPRGVCLSVKQQLCVADALHKALQFQAPGQTPGQTQRQTLRHLCLLPLSTLLENVSGVYYPLLSGGTVITPTETDTGFSGSTGLDMLSMLRAFSRHQPTSIILLPQMLVGLVAALETGWKAPAALRFAAVGGAKVSPELIRCARDFGLPVYEGYGLSETASVACLNHPGKDLPGSVGSPLSHVQVSVDDGEIIIAGNTFLGYLNEPDSWGKSQVATGDLGELDADGFVHLSGRRKNLLISSFGRNISPEWVESELLLHPEIAQCVVVGDARPYCTALIAAASPAVDNQRIGSLLETVNKGLPDYARIQRWHRLQQSLGHVDGLFTENGRPRRTAIAEHFASTIDSMYDDSDMNRSANTSNEEPLRALSL